MMLIKNETINVHIKRAKNGEVKKYKYHNRILDNALNHFIAGRRLESSLANSLYPNLVSGLGIVFGSLFNFTYIKYDISQNIQDSDVTMLYDDTGVGSAEIDGTKFIVGPAFDGKKIGGIGFGVPDGIANPSIGAPYWLNAYVDLLFLDIQVFTGDEIHVFRDDIISTNMTIVQDGFQFMTLPFPSQSERYAIDKISFSFDDQGAQLFKTYNFSDLNVVRGAAGELIITGFDPFESPQTEGLFPSEDLFPSDELFPSCPPQYKSCVIEYFNNLGNVKTLTLIRDLDISFDGGTIELRYKIERGQ